MAVSFIASACAAPALGHVVFSVPHDCELWVTSVEVWPNLGAATTATKTDEPRLEIREPYTVRPKVGVQSDVMATMAIDQYAAHAHLAHLSEGDLERSPVSVRRRVASDRAGHAATKSLRRQESNYRFVGSRGSLELLPVVGVEDFVSPVNTMSHRDARTLTRSGALSLTGSGVVSATLRQIDSVAARRHQRPSARSIARLIVHLKPRSLRVAPVTTSLPCAWCVHAGISRVR